MMSQTEETNIWTMTCRGKECQEASRRTKHSTARRVKGYGEGRQIYKFGSDREAN